MDPRHCRGRSSTKTTARGAVAAWRPARARFCVAACPRKVLRIKETLNVRGVNPAEYVGEGCIGCAICFYNCPEPYAIQVHKPEKK